LEVLGILLIAVATVWGLRIWGRSLPEKPPAPSLSAAEEYWAAYVQANEGLGRRSISADAFARLYKANPGNKNLQRLLKRWSMKDHDIAATQASYWRKSNIHNNSAETEEYWSSYDGGKIWEQRSVEMEAQSTSLYSQLRVNIPDLEVSSLESYPVHRVQISPNEPLRDFWSRYDATNVNGLGVATDDALSRASPNSTSVPEFPPKPKPDYSHLPPHLALIGETQAVREKLTAAAQMETGEFGSDLAKMVQNVDTIIDTIRVAPAKLGDVQRLFTYYLPEVGKLLEARLHMQAVGETQRVAEIEAILDRIETAFQQFAARMHQADIRALDIDLKLLDQSLAAEFESQIGT
jgi:5-bromo-4-chloroindolyl phosphate hydrolysis protein